MSNKYQCENCGKQLSRSGYYKHIKKCSKDGSTVVDDGNTTSSSSTSTHQEPSSAPPSTLEDISEEVAEENPTTMEWTDFVIGEGEGEGTTESIPQPLKMLANNAKPKNKKKLTKAEKAAMANLEQGILKSGLIIADEALTAYGKAVWKEDYECKHSNAERDLVSKVQHEYLASKGITVSDKIPLGGLAVGLTGAYVGIPLYKIQKGSGKNMLKGRLISRIFAMPKRIIKRILNRRKKGEEDDN